VKWKGSLSSLEMEMHILNDVASYTPLMKQNKILTVKWLSPFLVPEKNKIIRQPNKGVREML